MGLFVSGYALGLYVAAVASTNLSRLVAQSLGMVAYPNIAARTDPAEARRAMWRFFMAGVFLCLVILALVELTIGHLISLLFGASFSGAVRAAQILLIGALFTSGRRILSDASRGAGLPLPSTAAEITSCVVLIPLLALLTPRFGIEGAATAVTLTSLAGLLVLLVGVIRRPGSAIISSAAIKEI